MRSLLEEFVDNESGGDFVPVPKAEKTCCTFTSEEEYSAKN